MAKVRTIDAFMDGRCFARVKTAKGVSELMKQIESKDFDATDRIDSTYKKDFGHNILASNYYLTYYKKQHALKAMTEEFFNKIYNSDTRSPYVFEV